MKCKDCVRHVHLNDDGERTVGTPNWCFYISDSPDEELERDCIAFKSLTNADRIRAMSDEELAEFINDVWDRLLFGNDLPGMCDVCYTDTIQNCKKCWLDWLKEEAVSNG